MDELISRQAAIDGLEGHYIERINLNDWQEGWNAALDWMKDVYLDEFPSAHPEQQWIPVTKKAHPDLPIRVQVQMDNGWIITAYYQEGEWLSVPDCGAPLLDNWIEAWCELPEPWRGEEK